MSCYIFGVNEVIKFCWKVKIWNCKVKIIVGGVYVFCCVEDFVDLVIDCIVLGDGIFQIFIIVEVLGEDKVLLFVLGLVLFVGFNKVLKIKGKVYMFNVDILLFLRCDFVVYLQYRYYYIFYWLVVIMKMAWGCWYKCNFCFIWCIIDGYFYV